MIKNNVYPRKSQRSTRQMELPKLYPPKVFHSSFRHTFLYKACNLWNQLPHKIVSKMQQQNFNKLLRQYIFEVYKQKDIEAECGGQEAPSRTEELASSRE